MSEGTVSELCRVLQKQGYRGDAVSVFADSLAYITHLEYQLAARNQAAEAMGVLERLVRERPPEVLLEFCGGDFAVAMDRIYIGTSLIEAVLKAGEQDG